MSERYVEIINSKDSYKIEKYFTEYRNLSIKVSNLGAFSFRSSYLISMLFIMIGFWVYSLNENNL